LRARSNFRELAKKNATHLKPQFKFATVAMPSLIKSKNKLGVLKQKPGQVPNKMLSNKSTTEAIMGTKEKIVRSKMFHTQSSKNAASKDLVPVSAAYEDSSIQNRQEDLIKTKVSLLMDD
jgi:hypothetical protein